MTSPHSFSIVGKNLKLNTAEDIQPVLDDLDKVDAVEEVHFGGNTLGVEACRALAKNLEGKKTLKVADFADIFTGRLISEIPDALRALCDALVNHESLVEINLSDNAFGGRSAEPMVNFLTNNHHFQVLKLNNNGLGITGGTIVANALIDAAKKIKEQGKTSNLRTVICGRNRLENGSAPVWAEAFQLHGGLQEVRMFQNGIRMEGIEAISKGLSHCKNLEVLDLQDNTATVKGSRAIAAALPSWPNLKTLNLSDMLLKPKGGFLVLTALSKGHNTNLETLQLQYDDIDRKALALLGPAISRHLSNLTKLEINGNWADEDDDCINDIKKALEGHGHEDALDELDEMDPEGEESEAEDDEDAEEQDDDDDEVEEAKPVAAAAPEKEETSAAVPAVAAVAAGAVGTTASAAAVAAHSSEGDKQAVTASEPEAAAVASEAPPAAIVGGPEGLTATTAASEVPASEPMTAVDAPAVEEKAAPSTAPVTAEPASEVPTSNTTSSVTDELVEKAKSPETAATETETAEEPAQVAAEVSQSAQAVPERSEQLEQTTDVGESAAAVHKEDEKELAQESSKDTAPATDASVDQVTNQLAATTVSDPPTSEGSNAAPKAKSGHGASGSVDLNNELYPSGAQASSSDDEAPKKKKGFKAAFGAVKELLFR